jgi:hypothetical protein
MSIRKKHPNDQQTLDGSPSPFGGGSQGGTFPREQIFEATVTAENMREEELHKALRIKMFQVRQMLVEFEALLGELELSQRRIAGALKGGG